MAVHILNKSKCDNQRYAMAKTLRSNPSLKAIATIICLFLSLINFFLANIPKKVSPLVKNRNKDMEKTSKINCPFIPPDISLIGGEIKTRMAPKEAKEISPIIAKITSKIPVFTSLILAFRRVKFKLF
jgi:hypothetical protein